MMIDSDQDKLDARVSSEEMLGQDLICKHKLRTEFDINLSGIIDS